MRNGTQSPLGATTSTATTSTATTSVLIDGLSLATSIDVPRAPKGNGSPDWKIRLALSKDLPSYRRKNGCPAWQVALFNGHTPSGCAAKRGSRIHVQLEGIGDLLASVTKREAVIYPADDSIDELLALRRLVPYLAALDERLVLHASCVHFPTGAVLFCAADAKAGTSTLALALDAIGRPVLADDQVVLEQQGKRLLAHPSFSFIDVGRRSSVVLRPNVLAFGGKQSIALKTPQPAEPVVVRRFAFLKRGETLGVTRLDYDEAWKRIRGQLLTVDLDPSVETEHAHWERAERMLDSVRVVELTVPDGVRVLSEQLDRLQALVQLA